MGTGCTGFPRIHDNRLNTSPVSKEARCALGQDGRGGCAFSPQTHCPMGSVAGTRKTWVWWVVLPSGSRPTPSSPLRPARTHCPGALQAAEVCDRAPHPPELGMTSSSLRRHIAGEKLPACAVQGQVQTACSPGSMQRAVQIPVMAHEPCVVGQGTWLLFTSVSLCQVGSSNRISLRALLEDGTSWCKC